MPTLAPTATPTPIPLPSPTPSACRWCRHITGTIRDEADRPVEGATIRFQSRESSVPYDVTVPIVAGAYQLDLPEGLPLDVVLGRPGWTTRRRGVYLDDRDMLRTQDLSFGFPADASYTEYAARSGLPYQRYGAGMFLSDYPEIERVEPATGTFDTDPIDGMPEVDPLNVALKLVFSELLDEATRQRLAAAVRLWPVEDVEGRSNKGDVERYMEARERDGVAAWKLDFSSEIPGAIDAGPGGRARASWDAEGRTLTFAVEGGIGVADKRTRYQLGLVSDGAVVTDAAGHALGTDHAGRRDAPVPAGQVLANVFCPHSGILLAIWLRPEERPTGADARWSETHTTTFGFRVRAVR